LYEKNGKVEFFRGKQEEDTEQKPRAGQRTSSIFAANGAARYGKRAVLHFVQCLDFCNA
jgi:hypothetical protein